MKRLAIILLATLGLGGCATLGGPTGQTTFEQVQAITIETCAFVPTVATVAQIIAVGNPTVATATAIATAICSAVTAPNPNLQARRRGVSPPSVLGVPVQGHFVQVQGYKVR